MAFTDDRLAEIHDPIVDAIVEHPMVSRLGEGTLDRMGTFAELLDETINTEMDLHRSYAAWRQEAWPV